MRASKLGSGLSDLFETSFLRHVGHSLLLDINKKGENNTNFLAITEVCPNATILSQSAHQDSIFIVNLEWGFYLLTDQVVPDI